MRAPRYEAALHEAKAYPQLWRLGLGLALTLFMTFTVAAMLVGAMLVVAGRIDPSYTIHVSAGLRSLQATASGYGGLDTPISVFILLVTFAGLFIGPLLAAAAFHFRGPDSLFGDFGDWAQGFLTALSVQVPILALLLAIGAWLDPPAANLPFDRWIWLVPLALPLIFIQSGAEELLFRGYLQQQLAARFTWRWIWMGLPAVIFAGLHWTPAAGANLPLILLAALTFGLIAADLSEQTGSLGAAMGLHFGNNVFGMLVVGMSDSVSGLALYVSGRPMAETGAQSVGIVFSTLVTIGIWWLLRRRLTR